MVTTLTAEQLGLGEEEVEVVDVLDLPQLYTRPSYNALLDTLADLRTEPSSLGSTPKSGTPRSTSGASTPFRRQRKVRSEGVPAYLTKIVASKLAWIEDDTKKEEVWEVAAQALSERSGRTAMGNITRSFVIPLGRANEESVELALHEPALTGDSLGHKTWTSSALLAQRLAILDLPLQEGSILELGSGTGLVGMAAACIFSTHVLMTDLSEITDNLRRNAETNARTIMEAGGSNTVGTLDWCEPNVLVTDDGASYPRAVFNLILAADVVYSEEHPQMLAKVIEYHLARNAQARVVFELPQRQGYQSELLSVKPALEGIGLSLISEGLETGYDDWSSGADQEPLEVVCHWTVWAWSDQGLNNS